MKRAAMLSLDLWRVGECEVYLYYLLFNEKKNLNEQAALLVPEKAIVPVRYLPQILICF